MTDYKFIELIAALWPLIVAFVGLIFWLAKSYADTETLKEKVKVLYDLYNRRDN